MLYQLLHTSPKLTGQVRWDLMLTGRSIDALYITPLSDDVVFTSDNKTNTLDCRHGDNVRELYRKVSDSFWSPVCDARLDGTQIVRSKGVYRDTHVSTYEMGMKRMKSYQQYGKQFSFLCPVWCDEPGRLKDMSFKITLRNGAHVLNTINVKLCDEGASPKLCRYVEAYAEDIKSAGMTGNELIYVDYQNSLVSLYGLNVESGQQMAASNSLIVKNLISRERPVMEFDSMICELLSNHKLVCNQLINFNLCFNINDLMIADYANDTFYEPLTVSVEAYCGDEKLEQRDIYSNYDSIPVYDCGEGKYTTAVNALNNLKDYRCIDLVKNKVTQPVFHWSLREMPEMSFNLYDGYAPAVKDGEHYVQASGISEEMPQVYSGDYDKNMPNFQFVKYHSRVNDINQSNWSFEIDKLMSDASNFYTVSKSALESSNSVWFGSILIDTKQLLSSFNKKGTKPLGTASGSIGWPVSNAVELSKDFVYMFAAIRVNRNISFNAINNLVNEQYRITYVSNHPGAESSIPLLGVIVNASDAATTDPVTVKVIYIISDGADSTVTDDETDERAFYDFYNLKTVSQTGWRMVYAAYHSLFGPPLELDPPVSPRAVLHDIKTGAYNPATPGFNHADYLDNYDAAFSAFNMICSLCECAVMPDIIETCGTLDLIPASRPDGAKEVKYCTNNHPVRLIRYGGSIMPMLIKEGGIRTNNVYWCKQYVDYIGNANDVDDVRSFATMATTGFLPDYPSIGYCTYNSAPLDYSSFYMSGRYSYTGEEEWFNSSVMRSLEESVTLEIVSTADALDTDTALFNHIQECNPNSGVTSSVFDNFIKDKYVTTYVYDYADNTTTDTFKFTVTYRLK